MMLSRGEYWLWVSWRWLMEGGVDKSVYVIDRTHNKLSSEHAQKTPTQLLINNTFASIPLRYWSQGPMSYSSDQSIYVTLRAITIPNNARKIMATINTSATIRQHSRSVSLLCRRSSWRSHVSQWKCGFVGSNCEGSFEESWGWDSTSWWFAMFEFSSRSLSGTAAYWCWNVSSRL
jgi:hypothetical protein